MGLFGRKVRPSIETGDMVDFKPGWSVMASGKVEADNGDGTFQVFILWSHTSLFELNKVYRVKPEELWFKS